MVQCVGTGLVDEPEVVRSQPVSTDVDLSRLLERRQLIVTEVFNSSQHRLERGLEASAEHLVIWFSAEHHAIFLLVGRHRDDTDIQLLYQTNRHAEY